MKTVPRYGVRIFSSLFSAFDLIDKVMKHMHFHCDSDSNRKPILPEILEVSVIVGLSRWIKSAMMDQLWPELFVINTETAYKGVQGRRRRQPKAVDGSPIDGRPLCLEVVWPTSPSGGSFQFLCLALLISLSRGALDSQFPCVQ